MAKIAIRKGNTYTKEVTRFKVSFGSGTTTHEAIFVLTDDGRVLRRYTGDAGTGYTIFIRIKDPKKRTAEFLRQQLEIRNYRIIKEGK